MNRNEGREQPRRISTLDGFRALAIMMVVAFHYNVRWSAPADVPPHLPVASPFARFIPFEYGWMGVQLFFSISGFVILMTLTRSRGLRDFAVRRFARLWPALIVASALTTLIVNAIGPHEWRVGIGDYATSLTLIEPQLWNLAGLHVEWVDSVYWTLWVELCFYFVAAILFFAARRDFLKVWLAFQLLVVVAALLLPAAAVEMIAFPHQLPYFTIGICTFELWSGTKARKLAIGGAVFAAALILADATVTHGAIQPQLPVIIGDLSIFALFALFLLDHPILKPFAWKPVVLLGQASYSLYLIHQEIGVSLLRQLSGIPFVAALALVVAVCVGTSLALFRWIEVPAKKWLVQRLSTRRPAAGHPAYGTMEV
ncbi:MAG TPA: acyltransferase [Sphingomicrobium sp.]|nr:acyltransferase [Sphingomicrobium sp.]